MPSHTDIYLEKCGLGFSEANYNPPHRVFTKNGIQVIESAQGKSTYHTVVCGEQCDEPLSFKHTLRDTVFEIFVSYCKKHLPSAEPHVLICGIGNADVTADSLGPAVCAKIIATGERATNASLFAVNCSVPLRTGIPTSAMIYSLAELTRADMIVTVDSLCTAEKCRLGAAIQLSDLGCTPGSALSHGRDRSDTVSSLTMPCPVVSVGVPTVMRIDTDNDSSPMLVSAAGCDRDIKVFSSVIAGALNSALLPL